ncbi:hypothetical protein DL89DRAFT_258711 [Linderina pennispora]|uniref:Uncharacterized protein n=1 Tax=Linderina pennispora TaxID=61395 RepID=A0A1Y1W3I8_9FUNG|nr:uncharacterized protein DL89DRAFT_258711 [Linderina pennispora]ORX68113.1 hypothetical protein DL89DRAFT_258711 [Linderina pennispora]
MTFDTLRGQKVDRNELFGDNTSDNGDGVSDLDDQDFAAFEKMMDARVKAEVIEAVADEAEVDGSSDREEESADVPVFQLFAGAGPAKVEIEAKEPEYVMPERPEPVMEESDSEEHWQALQSAVIDAEQIKKLAATPLPAMRYLHRVVHIPLEEKTEPKRTRRRRSHHAKKASRKTFEPYYKELSPYNGGVVRGAHLSDVVSQGAASGSGPWTNSGRGGRGGAQGGRGRGRGRGRGH